MPPDVRQEFRDSGLYHLVSVDKSDAAFETLGATALLSRKRLD
jgi:hypothetical protein